MIRTRLGGDGLDAATDAGPRPRNEDRFRVRLDLGYPFLALADGMGGYEAGDLAATLVMEAAGAAGSPPATVAELQGWMERVILDAESRIQNEARSRGKGGMGSTVVLACVLPDTVAVAHVGDSRAYLVNRLTAQRLTRDHSVGADAVTRGVVTEAEMHTVPYHEALVRSLGALGAEGPDFQTFSIGSSGEESLLVLCTDGIWNVISDSDLPGLLFDATGSQVKDPAHVLVASALDRGTGDNATAVVLEVGGRAGRKVRKPLPRMAALAALAALVALFVGVGLAWLTLGSNRQIPAEPLRPTVVTSTPVSPAGGVAARILWIRTSHGGGLEARVGRDLIGGVPAGTFTPLRLLLGDSLLLRWTWQGGADSVFVVVEETTPDTIVVPTAEGGPHES